jgi:hypothetical protein
MGGFIRAAPGVVKEQKKEVIASPLRTPEVRGPEKCVDFGLLQIGDGRLSAFLEGYGTDFSAPSEMLGTMQGHKASHRVDGRQALVPRGDGAVPALLQMKKKQPHPVGGYVDYIQFIDAPVDFMSDERNQQSKGVPVASLRAAGQIPLMDQVFQKEAADPGTESAAISHNSPPRKHIWRSVYWLRVTTLESS